MAIDNLQERIRKLKNPLVVDFTILPASIPPHILEAAESTLESYICFCKKLLSGLKAVVPAVRFDFNAFAILGNDGLVCLETVLSLAKEQGYYVLLDGVNSLSGQSAEAAAEVLMEKNCKWQFDGLILSSYIGSDGLRPYVALLKDSGKDLFAVIRTANRSASELQDLLTGGRLVHIANADIVNRYADATIGKSGYSQVGIMASASSADSLRTLRTKYKNLFMLLDGYDYPNANAKNCSFAFDNLGHGAVACAGSSITSAWQLEQTDGTDYVEQAVAAAERARKNLTRYVTIL